MSHYIQKENNHQDSGNHFHEAGNKIMRMKNSVAEMKMHEGKKAKSMLTNAEAAEIKKTTQNKNQVQAKKIDEKKVGVITGDTEITDALNKTTYGQSLVQILKDSGLDYKINIKSNNSGKFGAPVKIMKEGVLVGYELNFQKYNKVELAGTRYDHAGKDEYYGGIGAHDVIDAGTDAGRAVNDKKVADWQNENSEFRTKYNTMANAKKEEKEPAKLDFFQFLIDNYEKIGMDAELKFREGLVGNTLDTPIGDLSLQKQQEDSNPNLKDKTPRDVYTKGVK